MEGGTYSGDGVWTFWWQQLSKTNLSSQSECDCEVSWMRTVRRQCFRFAMSIVSSCADMGVVFDVRSFTFLRRVVCMSGVGLRECRNTNASFRSY